MPPVDTSRNLLFPETPTKTPDQPFKCSGTNAPERDIRDQQERDQPDQPRPDLHSDARLAPSRQEGVLRLRQGPSARQLGELAQEALVDTQVAQLLSIRYH